MSHRVIVPATFVAVLAAGAMTAAPASAAADERPGAQYRAAPWCGKTVWKSGLWKKVQMLKRFDRILTVADAVDSATDFATLVLTIASAGAVAVPNAVVKVVAKIGKAALTKVVKRLRAATVRVRHKKVGVRVKVGCVWGVVPYPSVGVYTP